MQLEQIFATLTGKTVMRVALERWFVRALFDTTELLIEAGWKLFDADGAVLDQSESLEQRGAFALWRLVGAQVSGISLADAPIQALTVSFTNGMALTTEANNDGFEDWSLIASDQSFWIVCNGCL